MLKVTFTAEDKFALLMGMGSNDVMMPRQLLTRADFPDLPDANVDQPAFIPYGDLSTVASSASPPVLDTDTSVGALRTSGWLTGFGHVACLATPPTTVTASAQAGGTLSINQPNAQYGVMITAVDTHGVESDSVPYHWHTYDESRGSFAGANSFGYFTPFAYATVDGTQKLHVTWSGATGAISKYRVYLGVWYYGFRPIQYIETTNRSCDFTASPDGGVPITESNITPEAHPISFSALWWYAVSAIMVDGETGLSTETQAAVWPYQRPVRILWKPVAGATGYRIYKRGAASTYLWRFDVGVQTYFDDDLTNAGATSINGAPQPTGLVPCLHVGTRKDLYGGTWNAFVVAGCAIKSIEKVYQAGVEVSSGSFATNYAVPGKGGVYTSSFGNVSYVDINGHRYTLLYIRGTQGDAAANGEAVSVTLKGVETSGNGTGTLITALADQYEHWLRNIALRDRTTVAPWDFDGPMWNDTPNDVDLVDANSFAEVKTVWAARDPGSCPGAWVLGLGESGSPEQVSARVVAARLNQSLDVFSGFTRKSQYAVKIINEYVDLDVTPQYTALAGINEGTFKVEDRAEQMENRITAYYSLNSPKKEWSTLLTEDTNAQSALGEIRPYDLKLWCIRRSDIASEIARRRLARRKFAYRIVTWTSDMGALTVDLGDIVRVSHPDGPGVNGWTDRACFIMKHDFDPQRFHITLEALDLDAVIELLAARVIIPPTGTITVTPTDATMAPSLQNTVLLVPAAAALAVTGTTPTLV